MSTINTSINAHSKTLGQFLKTQELYITTAESCTAGGLAYAITSTEGSSAWFDRGFITYSNLSKQSVLNIPEHILKTYGAVSSQTAEAMAEGALKKSIADISLSITGIAGPSGGTPQKPVGTICFGLAQKSRPTQSMQQLFHGDREQIRQRSINFCLHWAVQILTSNYY